jgi:membrane fusion protein (multidrug efflux system)
MANQDTNSVNGRGSALSVKQDRPGGGRVRDTVTPAQSAELTALRGPQTPAPPLHRNDGGSANRTTADEDRSEDARARRRRMLRLTLMAGGIFVVLAGSFVMWLRGGRYASTDDAYVQAAKLVVTTDVSGIVTSVDVHEGQVVKAGDVLFRVDPRQFQIAVANAAAQLAMTAETIEALKQDYRRMLHDIDAQQAQVELDQANFSRVAKLVHSDTVSESMYDQARFSLAAGQAKLDSLRQQAQVQLARLGGDPNIPVTQHPQYLQVKAQLDEAQRQLDHSVVRAPFSGIATQVDALQPGTYLAASTAALTTTGAIGLVANDDLWVVAFMKETDLTYVRPGNHVDIKVDTYPGHTWSGTVQSISPASASQFSILPAQNASGNWVKVVQRIPVRIGVNQASSGSVLRSGMSVTVNIDTGHHRSLMDLF